MEAEALIYCENEFGKLDGKVANGLVRHSEKFEIVGVIDSTKDAMDAGEYLDGVKNGVPIFKSIYEAIANLQQVPKYFIYGMAPLTPLVSDEDREVIYSAMKMGMDIINGLPEFFSDDLQFAQKAKGLGIAKDISFIGPVADTASWYKMVDLFVLPTLYDPFSNSCLEALACGCPVLTTQSNGVSECLNESNGLAVKNPQDVVQGNVIKWIKEIRNLNRKLISESVKELTSENEINSYLQLLNA